MLRPIHPKVNRYEVNYVYDNNNSNYNYPTESPSLTGPVAIETLGELGRTLTLPCPSAGVPAPRNTWLRDAVPLDTLADSRCVDMEGRGGL